MSFACNHYYCLSCLCAGSAMQAANLLLMDSVAGVGYSYSLDSSDYNTSDSQAQTDTAATLREWFRMYPFFANHFVFLQGDAHAKLCKSALTHDTQSLHTAAYVLDPPHLDKTNDMQNMIIAVQQILKVASYRIYTRSWRKMLHSCICMLFLRRTRQKSARPTNCSQYRCCFSRICHNF